MAVPAVSGPFAALDASPDTAGWPTTTTAWVNLRLVSAAWQIAPAPEPRAVVVVDGVEHVVRHTVAELGAAMAVVT